MEQVFSVFSNSDQDQVSYFLFPWKCRAKFWEFSKYYSDLRLFSFLIFNSFSLLPSATSSYFDANTLHVFPPLAGPTMTFSLISLWARSWLCTKEGEKKKGGLTECAEKSPTKLKEKKEGAFKGKKRQGGKRVREKILKKKAKLPGKHPFEAKPSCKNKDGEKHEQKKAPSKLKKRWCTKKKRANKRAKWCAFFSIRPDQARSL